MSSQPKAEAGALKQCLKNMPKRCLLANLMGPQHLRIAVNGQPYEQLAGWRVVSPEVRICACGSARAGFAYC